MEIKRHHYPSLNWLDSPSILEQTSGGVAVRPGRKGHQ
jgi:hypothetical protein